MPQPFVLEGDVVNLFAERQRRVTAETHRCHWDGGRPDYSAMVEGLDRAAKTAASTADPIELA